MNILPSVLKENSDVGVKIDTGLTREQFFDLFRSLPTLREAYKNDKNASDSLYMYLMKIRTARSNDDIGRVFKLTGWTVGQRIAKVRAAMENDFVYNNVNYLCSREDLANSSTFMSQMIFCHSDINRPVLICDGTYVYIQKSTNFEVQKSSYTDHKKRNFVRIMMCTTTNGMIVFALGPYAATCNDAKVMKSIIEKSNAFDSLVAGDVILLDRGFRDCEQLLLDKGYDVKMPCLLQRSKNKHQLSTSEANRSRLVTANRYGVETRNGHVKTIFKIFQKEWNPSELPHLMADFRICAALINKYFKTIESNKDIAIEIATRMLNRLEKPNKLAEIVFKDAFQKKVRLFEIFDEFEELPHLSQMDLIWIALGKYQIKQAPSYCQEHLKVNDSQFVVFACPDEMCETLFTDFLGYGELKLLMARLKSRFRSNKYHDAYLLINTGGQGENAVLEYCCSCYNGLRTVGCCSHVMCLIWYALHIKDTSKVHRPAAFLNNYFDDISSSDNDSDED